MAHAAVRATLMPEIIRLIMEKYSLSEKEALDKFYTSAAGASFADDETGLYGQSALYVFGLFDEEMRGKHVFPLKSTPRSPNQNHQA